MVPPSPPPPCSRAHQFGLGGQQPVEDVAAGIPGTLSRTNASGFLYRPAKVMTLTKSPHPPSRACVATCFMLRHPLPVIPCAVQHPSCCAADTGSCYHARRSRVADPGSAPHHRSGAAEHPGGRVGGEVMLRSIREDGVDVEGVLNFARWYYTGLQRHAGLGCIQAPCRLRASMALVHAWLVHTGTSQ